MQWPKVGNAKTPKSSNYEKMLKSSQERKKTKSR